MTATQLALFDYAALDSETRIVVQQRTTEIKALMKRAAECIIDIGHKITEVRAKLSHGQYLGWLDSEGIERTFAWRCCQVASTFPDPQMLHGATFHARALYLLAAPSTPDTAREEAIERAGAGEVITYSKARELTNNHKAPYPDEQDYLEAYERQIEEALTPYEAEIVRREDNRQQQMAVITASSETNEWYTPLWIVDLARDVLGEIDLDPASCLEAQTVVRAQSYCTASEDGYSQPWFGRVWLNPPYGTAGEGAAGWARKLIREYQVGQVTAAILLVKAALGYNWFEELWYTYPTCLLRERVTFISPVDGTARGPAKHATALIYLGKDVDTFRSTFRPYGRVILPEE